MTVPYLGVEHPIRFAHRGSRMLWPENTVYAFAKAVELGYRYIETDVRISRDRHVVVFHDASLERTTNGSGKVSDWDLEDLRKLDAAYHFDLEGHHPLRGTGIGISTLREVFEQFPEAHFNIDLKGAGMEWPVADVIRDAGRVESTMIGSFIGHRTAKFRRITGGEVATSAGPREAMAMWIASRRGRSVRKAAAAYQLPFNYKSLPIDRKFVAAIHAAGAQVHFWTVNDKPNMERLLELGADGIITDRPDLLNEVLGY